MEPVSCLLDDHWNGLVVNLMVIRTMCRSSSDAKKEPMCIERSMKLAESNGKAKQTDVCRICYLELTAGGRQPNSVTNRVRIEVTVRIHLCFFITLSSPIVRHLPRDTMVASNSGNAEATRSYSTWVTGLYDRLPQHSSRSRFMAKTATSHIFMLSHDILFHILAILLHMSTTQ